MSIVLSHRGAYRDRHGRWERDAVDAAALGVCVMAGQADKPVSNRTACWTKDAEADGEVVWFWRPKAGVKFAEASRPNRASGKTLIRATTVATKPGRRGEREVSRKTIARGMPELLRLNLWRLCSCAFFICTRGYGCSGTRHSLRPLICWANGSCKTRTHRAAGSRTCI